MATRPAWTITDNKVVSSDFEFTWNGGFSVVQKQKNVSALHEAIRNKYNEYALEVSSKSTEELGKKLSAFSLKCGNVPLENVFQSSKKYQNGGPYEDLIEVKPSEAKRDGRHRTSGNLTAFVYSGETWPLQPATAFYDYLYITSLINSYGKELDLSKYYWFTDIEFNPNKSINCQARSTAIYKLIQQMDKFDVLESQKSWISFHEKYVV